MAPSGTNLPEAPSEAQTGSSVLVPLLSEERRKTPKSSDSEDEAKREERARERELDFARSKERRDRRAKKRKEKKKSKHSKKRRRRDSGSSSSSGSESEDEETAREKRVQAEMEKERKRLEEVNRLLSMDERKRPYHSLSANDGHVPTHEEMEAYYRLRQDPNDPMSHFKD